MAREDTEEVEAALLAFLDGYRQARARMHADPALFGLTNSQFSVLAAAAAHGAGGIGRIASAAGLSQPAATRALRRLEDKQLVRRRAAEHDGRRTEVVLTAEGVRLLEHHRSRLRAATDRLVAQAAPAAPEDVAALLRALAVAVRELP